MKEIQMCPSVEELDAEIQAHFDKELAEHGERAKEITARLAEKGIKGGLFAESSYTSWSTEAFGFTFNQRKLDRRGWKFQQEDALRPEKFFTSLAEALLYLETVYLPPMDWGFFDRPYDERIDKIRHELGKANGTMTIATTGVVEPAAWILQVFENGKSLGDPVVSKGFEKLSQLLAFMEERLKIK